MSPTSPSKKQARINKNFTDEQFKRIIFNFRCSTKPRKSEAPGLFESGSAEIPRDSNFSFSQNAPRSQKQDFGTFLMPNLFVWGTSLGGIVSLSFQTFEIAILRHVSSQTLVLLLKPFKFWGSYFRISQFVSNIVTKNTSLDPPFGIQLGQQRHSE